MGFPTTNALPERATGRMRAAGECACCGNTMTDGGRQIKRCAACGFLTASFDPGFGRSVQGLGPLQAENDRVTLDEIRRQLGTGRKRLLDIGSGEGGFLAAATVQGFDAVGVEPAPAGDAGAASGNFVHRSCFPQHPQGEHHLSVYDAVTFNHTFEHLPDPVAAAAAASRLLRLGGVAAFQLPSSSGFLFRLARKLVGLGFASPWDMLWQKDLPSPHVTYFNPANLCPLLERETELRPAVCRRLRSVRVAGLWRRIRCRYPLPTAVALFVPTLAACPLLSLLPPDFVLLVYAKTALSGGDG